MLNLYSKFVSTIFKSSSKISEVVQKLKIEIETKLKIEVILWDEEYSSIIANQRVIESVTKKSKRKDKGLVRLWLVQLKKDLL